MSCDCTSPWLSDILRDKHTLCHNGIYSYAVGVCYKYAFCAWAVPAVPGNPSHMTSHEIPP